jgi:hypothetical protein
MLDVGRLNVVRVQDGLLCESGERGLLFGLSHHVSRRDNVAEFVMRQTYAFLVLWEVGRVWMVQDKCGVCGGRSAAGSFDGPLPRTAAHNSQVWCSFIFLFASQRRLECDLWYLGGDWEGLMELGTLITLDHGEHKSG